MLPEQLPLGLTAAVVVANVIVTAWLLWLVRTSAPSDGRDTDATPDGVDAAPSTDRHHDAPTEDAADAVQCSTCGVENDPDYRYCRYCVAELSEATTVASAADGPMGRLPK